MTITATAGVHTYREIMGQTDAWAATLADGMQIYDRFLTQLKHNYAEIVFTGCGSTYYLALTVARVWEMLCGIPTHAVPASDLWLFPGAWLADETCLLVALSRSGETTETLRALKTYHARSRGDSLGITCNPHGAMMRDATLTLVARDALEQSVAQTRSFTSMFLLAQYICALQGKRPGYVRDLAALPAQGTRLISQYESLMRAIACDGKLEHFVFLGSGPLYGLACEAMLKTKELSLTWCEAFHFLEYRHGPKSTVTPRTLVIGLSSDTAYESEIAVLKEMQELGATVLAIGESVSDFSGDHVVELHSGLGEIARSTLYLPLVQLLAYYRGLAKDLDPDLPTHLDAVVRL